MKASYDLLIVGAGFAAAVLAERFARNRDDRYLTEKLQALPADGYTALIHRMHKPKPKHGTLRVAIYPNP